MSRHPFTPQPYSKFYRFKRAGLTHLRDCITSLGDICRKPFASLLTIVVIGLALSLPLAFLVVLNNVSQCSSFINHRAEVSVFLKTTLSEEKRLGLEAYFKSHRAVSEVKSISPQAALAELNAAMEIGDAVLSSSLPQNPLPWVLVLTLRPEFQSTGSEEVEKWLNEIRSFPEVDIVHLDLQWLKKLMSGILLVKQLVTGLSLLLALAVLFIIGNTLRLNIENQREKIELLKLIGATPGFVRRPFLYLGIWFGGLGAALSWFIILIFNGWIQRSATDFFSLYNISFQWLDPSTNSILTLLGLGMMLGFGAAWFAVSRYLRSIEVV